MKRFAASLPVLILLCLLACAPAPSTFSEGAEAPFSGPMEAQPWPEADALFRSDPKWLGSDGAYSIDLGDGRVLWLFGDSFISTSFLNTRRIATMVRNTVAVQSGYDPSAASMAFYWRMESGKPRSFFPEDGQTWFWPGHGIRVGDKLVIFLVATRSTAEGIGFEHTGWRAVSISHPEQAPSEWQLEWLPTPENPFGLIVSGSVIRTDGYLCAFSVQEPDHTIHLVRWLKAQVMNQDLSRPQWWVGEMEGWVPQNDLYYPRFLRVYLEDGATGDLMARPGRAGWTADGRAVRD
jgi:hypothetical protein